MSERGGEDAPAVRIGAYGPAAAGVDAVLPFQVDALDLRGRAIQMGPALDAILGRHDYPEAVSRLLAEAIVLAVLIGSALKFEGKFILQATTDGAVSLMVVDFRTPGDVRAYARYDADAVATAVADGDDRPAGLLGKGVLAMTIDQGPDTARYQGLVALDGVSLEEVAHGYFRQSEQIPTRVRLAAAELLVREKAGGGVRRFWRAGGLMAQFMPEAPERVRRQDISGGDAPSGHETADEPPGEDDAWTEAQSLVGTVADVELLDPDVPVERLLFRLFHERGVKVYDPVPIRDTCSCSRDRISSMLRRFTAEEIEQSVENDEIVVTCEFCGTRYRFDPADFRDGK